MSKGKLYEFCVIHHPKPKKDMAGNEEQAESTILTDVTRVLAATLDEVSILAARSIPKDYEKRLSEVEIVVRPF